MNTAGWDRNHPQTNTEKNIPTTFRADINVLGSYEFRKSVRVSVIGAIWALEAKYSRGQDGSNRTQK